MLKGCIIEESLKDTKILNQLKVLETRTSDNDHWHLYMVSVSKEQIEAIAKSLDIGKWYTHFWDDKGNMTVVFSGGKIFDCNYNDKSTWKEAIAHGLKLGIPKKQLDFLIY